MSTNTHLYFFKTLLQATVALLASTGLILPAWSQDSPADEIIE